VKSNDEAYMVVGKQAGLNNVVFILG